MKNYANLLSSAIHEGTLRTDRTGQGALSIFGGMLTFDLRERFPLVTLKETRYRLAILEMLWFLRGSTDTAWLRQHGCKLWDAWATEDGQLGPIYGAQWRAWNDPSAGVPGRTIDQIAALIQGIKHNPYGRRHLVSAWNVPELPHMGLPPCHWAFQCFAEGTHLDMMVHQRSWDLGLGAPFNIAQYALLLHLLARATGRQPRMLKFTYGDAHVYLNHVEPLAEMLRTRTPVDDAAKLHIHTDNTDIDGYLPEHFSVSGYTSHPHIALPVSV